MNRRTGHSWERFLQKTYMAKAKSWRPQGFLNSTFEQHAAHTFTRSIMRTLVLVSFVGKQKTCLVMYTQISKRRLNTLHKTANSENVGLFSLDLGAYFSRLNSLLEQRYQMLSGSDEQAGLPAGEHDVPSGSRPSHPQQRNSLPYSEPDESWRLELTCSCELLAADNIDMWKWNPHHISETDLKTGFGNKESSPVSQRRLRTVRMDHKAYDCACALGLVVLVVEM